MQKIFEHLKPCMYKYNDKVTGLETNKFTMGIMVQDVRMGLEKSGYNPDDFTITTMQPTGYYSLDYVQLIPVLISKVKELEKEIQKLKAAKQ